MEVADVDLCAPYSAQFDPLLDPLIKNDWLADELLQVDSFDEPEPAAELMMDLEGILGLEDEQDMDTGDGSGACTESETQSATSEILDPALTDVSAEVKGDINMAKHERNGTRKYDGKTRGSGAGRGAQAPKPARAARQDTSAALQGDTSVQKSAFCKAKALIVEALERGRKEAEETTSSKAPKQVMDPLLDAAALGEKRARKTVEAGADAPLKRQRTAGPSAASGQTAPKAAEASGRDATAKRPSPFAPFYQPLSKKQITVADRARVKSQVLMYLRARHGTVGPMQVHSLTAIAEHFEQFLLKISTSRENYLSFSNPSTLEAKVQQLQDAMKIQASSVLRRSEVLLEARRRPRQPGSGQLGGSENVMQNGSGTCKLEGSKAPDGIRIPLSEGRNPRGKDLKKEMGLESPTSTAAAFVDTVITTSPPLLEISERWTQAEAISCDLHGPCISVRAVRVLAKSEQGEKTCCRRTKFYRLRIELPNQRTRRTKAFHADMSPAEVFLVQKTYKDFEKFAEQLEAVRGRFQPEIPSLAVSGGPSDDDSTRHRSRALPVQLEEWITKVWRRYLSVLESPEKHCEQHHAMFKELVVAFLELDSMLPIMADWGSDDRDGEQASNPQKAVEEIKKGLQRGESLKNLKSILGRVKDEFEPSALLARERESIMLSVRPILHALRS